MVKSRPKKANSWIRDPSRNIGFLPILSDMGGNISEEIRNPKKYIVPKSPIVKLFEQCKSSHETQFYRE